MRVALVLMPAGPGRGREVDCARPGCVHPPLPLPLPLLLLYPVQAVWQGEEERKMTLLQRLLVPTLQSLLTDP